MLIYTLPAESFGGEFKRTDYNYQAFLQRVSAEARTRNMEEAERRIASGKYNSADIKKVLYKMGRDPDYVSSPHFDGVSELCCRVKAGAAGFKALDIFYNWENIYEPGLKEDAEGAVARLWIGSMENRQAVTNRKKIVSNELTQAIQIVRDDTVRIFSLAGGDGQTIIEAIKRAGRKVQVILVDPDRDALASAQRRVREAGLEDCFVIKRGVVSTARRLVREFRPHIFDVVGLLDYLDDDKVVGVVKIAEESLCSGGTLITCNIVNNKERTFLENVLLWFMIYREPEELGQLLLAGGFQEEKIKIILEPFRIHTIAVCRK